MDLAWLYNMNRGIFMTPGREEEWTLSVTHSFDDCDAFVAAFEELAARPDGLAGLSSGTSASPCSAGGRGRRGTSPWPGTSRAPAA